MQKESDETTKNWRQSRWALETGLKNNFIKRKYMTPVAEIMANAATSGNR
jgi:hypothetical protein